MKKAVLRDNMRKQKSTNHQQKNIQSQSPPHKKLLKKIEMTHKEPTHKYEFSLQDNLLHTEPKEEAVDFRVEIERRFQRSVANKVYVFPRDGSDRQNDGIDSESSSNNSSFESIRHVTIYDLNSQNKKKKLIHANTANIRNPPNVLQESNSNFQQKAKPLNINTQPAFLEAGEEDDVPLEIRIRDKSSSAYKNLIGLLEKHLNGQTPNQHPPQHIQFPANQTQNTQPSHNVLTTSNQQKKESDLQGYTVQTKKRENENKSQDRTEKPLSSQSEIRQVKYTNSSQGFKKTLSSEKVSSKFDTTSTTISNLEKSLGNIGSSSTKATTIDISKLTHDSIKKIYSNSMIKSVTPSYVNTKASGNFKENIFRTYTQENYPASSNKTLQPPSNPLYQKAQHEVINKTLRLSSTIKSTKQLSNSNLNSIISTKREETPKDMHRKINFSNFYGSPDPQDKLLSSINAGNTSNTNLSKKNSTKAMQVISPKKSSSNEKHIYMSYDLTHPKVVKKPAFKLDLTKRSQGNGRDILSSARSRNNKILSGAGGTSEMNAESLLRTSYDVQQYSSILNSSTQRNSSKKGTAFTPNSHTMKNLSFTKVNLMNK